MLAQSDIVRIKRTLAKLRNVDPEMNPDRVAAALRAMMERVLSISRTKYMSGPRPRRLDMVTGELSRSLVIDDSRLPRSIAGGTELIFAPVHEFGRGARRAFFLPALDDALPQFGEILEREMLRAVDRS